MSVPLHNLSLTLERFLAAQSMSCQSGKPGSAQLVMIRGCEVAGKRLVPTSDPDICTDRYEDTMVVFGRKAGGTRYLETVRASARPGTAWVRSATYRGSDRGCPVVQPGQYKYVRGQHRGKEAMRQKRGHSVCVIRDIDQDGRVEQADRVDYPQDTGINIHAGGRSERVGRNSSGCQIIWGGWGSPQWERFHRLIYGVAAGQDVFLYTVVDYDHLSAWYAHKEREYWRRWLFYGSHGFQVRDLQKLLAASEWYPGRFCDGVFGPMTDRAVRAVRKEHGMSMSGYADMDVLDVLTGRFIK